MNTCNILEYDDEEDEDDDENGMNFSDRDEGIVLRDTNVSFPGTNIPGVQEDETEGDDFRMPPSSSHNSGAARPKRNSGKEVGSSKDVGKYENLGSKPSQEPSLIYTMLGKENED